MRKSSYLLIRMHIWTPQKSVLGDFQGGPREAFFGPGEARFKMSSQLWCQRAFSFQLFGARSAKMCLPLGPQAVFLIAALSKTMKFLMQ